MPFICLLLDSFLFNFNSYVVRTAWEFTILFATSNTRMLTDTFEAKNTALRLLNVQRSIEVNVVDTLPT